MTRDELNDIASDTVVLFGAGNYGEQTLRSMRARPSFFVDNERRKRAVGRYLGLEVKSPEHISDLIESGSDLYVVVCVARYRELVRASRNRSQLMSCDWTWDCNTAGGCIARAR